MDPAERFIRLARRPEAEIPLDEACLQIARHLDPATDGQRAMVRLDGMAADVEEPTLEGVRALLFDRLGFRGDTTTYGDPVNSFLDQVVERRLGIPITLSILTIAVGQRVGVRLTGIGMPGHFLVRDEANPERYLDPFSRGAILDRDDCLRIFHRLQGREAEFHPHYLEPTRPRAILLRVLANLRAGYQREGDRRRQLEVLRLQAAIPGVPSSVHRQFADVARLTGAFDVAARSLESAADNVSEPESSRLRAQAHQLWARLN